VGAPLRGKKVLIVDDVMTAGTAKREAIDKIRKEGGILVGILVHSVGPDRKTTGTEWRRRFTNAKRDRRDQETVQYPRALYTDSQRHYWGPQRASIRGRNQKAGRV
jgi:hypoxanthine phosphoribosyltransferase